MQPALRAVLWPSVLVMRFDNPTLAGMLPWDSEAELENSQCFTADRRGEAFPAGARPYTNPIPLRFLFEIKPDPPSQGHGVYRLTLPQRKTAVVSFVYAKHSDV